MDITKTKRYPTKAEIIQYSCPRCGVSRTVHCNTDEGHRRRHFHVERAKVAAKALGLELPHARGRRKVSSQQAQAQRDAAAVTSIRRAEIHQERKWASRSGRVAIRYVCPTCGQNHPADQCEGVS